MSEVFYRILLGPILGAPWEGNQASRPIAKPSVSPSASAAPALLCSVGVPLDTPQKPAAPGTLLSALVLGPLAQLVRSLMSTDWEKADVMLHGLGIDTKIVRTL